MASNWFVFSMEPYELESRFGSDQALIYDEETEEEQEACDLEASLLEEEYRKLFADQMEKVNMLMKYLDPVERDYLNLYFNLNRDQNDIAKIFNITQGAVSYRCKTAIDRIKFLLYIPRFYRIKLVDDLDKVMPEPLYTEILLLMYETSSQSAVARHMGFSQGQVRYRLLRALDILKIFGERDLLYRSYFKCFDLIRDHPNITRNMDLSDFWLPVSEIDLHGECLMSKNDVDNV